MSIVCLDGVVTDKELADWHAEPVDVSLQLTCEQVRAVFQGPCLARGTALEALTETQILKLFPNLTRRKNAWKLRMWAVRIQGPRARRVLASASWHQLREAARFDEEEAQIRAAIAYAVRAPSRASQSKKR